MAEIIGEALGVGDIRCTMFRIDTPLQDVYPDSRTIVREIRGGEVSFYRGDAYQTRSGSWVPAPQRPNTLYPSVQWRRCFSSLTPRDAAYVEAQFEEACAAA